MDLVTLAYVRKEKVDLVRLTYVRKEKSGFSKLGLRTQGAKWI